MGRVSVELLLNDLSFHGQFPDIPTFRGAVERLLKIREVGKRFGRELSCHRSLLQAQVTRSEGMQQAIQKFARDERRVLMLWLTRQGPFWEDIRQHTRDDYLECNGILVTDTAVGEAAFCCLRGHQRLLVSVVPSDWLRTPVEVTLVETNANDARTVVSVTNHWEPHKIEAELETAPLPIGSWQQLETVATSRCRLLTFAAECFEPLNGRPFNPAAAQRLLLILNTLDQFKRCFDSQGQRTEEGHRLYQQFFTGKQGDGGRGSLFSDSSDGEKQQFKAEMTFKNPATGRKDLFCPWHGKVQTPQLRVHFSWPVRRDKPLYIVYVGPKISRR